MPELAAFDIIIPAWNSGSLLRECLESITRTSRIGFKLSRVVVIDNGSTDGSLDGLEDLDLPLTLVRNDKNRGFAAACNQGAEGSKASYLLFLNSDTRLFENSLSTPLAFLESTEHAEIGIVGLQLVDDTGNVCLSFARFPTPSRYFAKMIGLDHLFPGLFHGNYMVEWDHGNSREVDQVIGAFFLVRQSLFEELGRFDERFFVYFEEVDFSLQARQNGWLSYCLTDAQAFHKGGGTSVQIKDKRLFYSLRSRILYGYKHFGWLAATILMLGTLFLEPFSRLVLGIIHHSWEEILNTIKGYTILWAELPQILRTAARNSNA